MRAYLTTSQAPMTTSPSLSLSLPPSLPPSLLLRNSAKIEPNRHLSRQSPPTARLNRRLSLLARVRDRSLELDLGALDALSRAVSVSRSTNVAQPFPSSPLSDSFITSPYHLRGLLMPHQTDGSNAAQPTDALSTIDMKTREREPSSARLRHPRRYRPD
ncbi:hypothetical protein CDD80_7466 [Ophiocordyceps camponoti-rufipedis]|uniref:Uncharacterized protein n=1 Tax=Ophiocordyceps camponoti-rufipedis TaxID=2004952 RepID=A0A2C5YIC4_9HYPO|nr:hypothetical protein CDD80_7466 [Ophiocordyceps camponoti-rufipedis]